VKVNVQSTIERILQCSEPVREKAESGEIQVAGAIYDITTGRVEFLDDEAPCELAPHKNAKTTAAAEALFDLEALPQIVFSA